MSLNLSKSANVGRKIVRNQIEPKPKSPNLIKYVAEFYGEKGPLGRVKIFCHEDDDALGIAFRQANPECLHATTVKFFRQ